MNRITPDQPTRNLKVSNLMMYAAVVTFLVGVTIGSAASNTTASPQFHLLVAGSMFLIMGLLIIGSGRRDPDPEEQSFKVWIGSMLAAFGPGVPLLMLAAT